MRNRDKRITRRRRRRLKRRFLVTTTSILIFITLATLVGIRLYQMKTAENPFGEVSETGTVDGDAAVLSDEYAEYTVFDTKGGESLLIKIGDTEVLIDAGASGGTKGLVKELKKKIDGSLDYFVLTSPSEKRLGGVESISKEFGINTLIVGEMGEKEKGIKNLFSMAGEIIDGQNLNIDIAEGASLSIFKPEVSSPDTNDRSLITYFTFGKTSFIGLSDAGKEEISKASSISNDFDCEVIVLSRGGDEEVNIALPSGSYGTSYVATHGSNMTLSPELIEYLGGEMLEIEKTGSLVFITDGETVELSEKKAGAEEKSEEGEE